MRDLMTLPKAELHIHLEGAMRIGTALDLADRQGLPVPAGLVDGAWRFRDFLDFIDQYIALCSMLNDPEDFRRLGYEVTHDLSRNGVQYAEAVFSPSNHAARLHGDWIGPIEAVLDGLEAGARDFGTIVRLTPDIVRDLGTEQAQHVLDVALRFAGRGVVALNCAGSERAGIEPFGPYFRTAKEAGLGSVPHAGEWAGPQNVWDTLAAFEPDRIGHGVRAIDDPELVATLAERAIPLEISPLSNVATGVYPSLAEHPFMRLRDAGVIVTLNSDDPPMFGDAWVGRVYEAARDAWGLDDVQLAQIARTAVDVSFADTATKREIAAGIDVWLGSEPEPVTAP